MLLIANINDVTNYLCTPKDLAGIKYMLMLMSCICMQTALNITVLTNN